MSTAGWSSGVFSLTKLYSTVSTSGPAHAGEAQVAEDLADLVDHLRDRVHARPASAPRPGSVRSTLAARRRALAPWRPRRSSSSAPPAPPSPGWPPRPPAGAPRGELPQPAQHPGEPPLAAQQLHAQPLQLLGAPAPPRSRAPSASSAASCSTRSCSSMRSLHGPRSYPSTARTGVINLRRDPGVGYPRTRERRRGDPPGAAPARQPAGSVELGLGRLGQLREGVRIARSPGRRAASG